MKSKKSSAKYQGKQPLNLKSNPSAIFLTPDQQTKCVGKQQVIGYTETSTQSLRSPSFAKLGQKYLYTNEELLSMLRQLRRRLGRTPEKRDLDGSHGIANSDTYYRRFGSIPNALRLAGIKTKYHTKEIK